MIGESVGAAPAGERLRRVRATVAYDGAPFHGFAVNHGVDTVAGTLERELTRVLRTPTSIRGAGRTDAGVHAWGQVITFDVAEDVVLADLQRRINRLVNPAIVLRSLDEAPTPDFDARFSAQWRRYRYGVLTTPWPSPFLTATTWYVGRVLDIRAMQLGCDPLIGEHDFSSFCRVPRVRSGSPIPSMTRRILDATWSDRGDGLLEFEIRATAFCQQMVRAIVGLLVEIGLGRRKAGEVSAVLRGRDRSLAAPIAPPHGLCLWDVGY